MAHPLGIPDLSQTQQARLAKSRTLLERSVHCLRATYAAGGHGHFMQCDSALSWHEPIVKQWLHESGVYIVSLPACQFGAPLCKRWLLSTSYDSLVPLGAECMHDVTHPDDNSSNVLSLQGTQNDYPACLTEAFASTLSLVPSMSLEQILEHIPVKSLQAPPHANVDGGGHPSKPDWSVPPVSTNFFKSIREVWIAEILSQKLHLVLAQRLQTCSSLAPFDEKQVQHFRTLFEQRFPQQLDWHVREDQPLCLTALQSVSQFMRDPDIYLFDSLIKGVSTGIDSAIPPSHVFSAVDLPPEKASQPDLSIHLAKWKSAEEHEDITSSLIQEELRQGWIEPFHGTVADAKLRWPLGVAVGKLGIAFHESRPPRLVVDPSISGANAACVVPEKQTMPSAFDVIRSFPLRNLRKSQSAFSLDIKSAHKRIVLNA